MPESTTSAPAQGETGPRMVPASALEDALVGLRFAYEGLTAHERAALSNTIARAEAALAAAVPSTAQVLAGLVEAIESTWPAEFPARCLGSRWLAARSLVQSRLSDIGGGGR